MNILDKGRAQEINSIHALKVSKEAFGIASQSQKYIVVSERDLLTASQTRKYCKASNELVYESPRIRTLAK